MTTVFYKLVLDGLVPEANDERVRRFLGRIYGDDIAAANLIEQFPMDVPGKFDFQRASEWMQALSRAGIRSRVEVLPSEMVADGAQPFDSERLQPDREYTPEQLWAEIWLRPATAFNWLATKPIWVGVLFGLALITLGNTLSYPGELWVLKKLMGPSVTAAATGTLILSLVLLEPILRLLTEALVLTLMLRMVGHKTSIARVAALCGPAHVADPLKAIPLVGSVIAFFTWIWMTGVALASAYDLSRGRVLALCILPAGLAALWVAMIGLILVAAASGVGMQGWSEMFSADFAF